MGIQCTSTFDVKTILQPLMLSSIFKEGEFKIDALIDVYVQEAIEKSLLANIELPQDFQDLGDIICLMLDVNKIKTVTAVIKGEQPPEGAGIDKVLELVVNLQMISALTKAFEGGAGGGSSGGGA